MTRQLPPALYHYTCAHQAKGIERDGYVQPHPQLMLRDTAMVWLTDLAPPVPPMAVGLTNHLVGCDRTEVAYQVHRTGVLPWTEWRNSWVRGQLTQLTPRDWRQARQAALALESAPNAMPSHWYIATDRVTIMRRID